MKRTYQPHRRRRFKVHGFLVRARTKKGRQTIQRRIKKGRKKVSISATK